MGEKINDHVPTIAEQGFHNVQIPNHKLMGAGEDETDAKFNGSLINYKGRLLFAYRGYHEDHGRRCVFLCELDKDYNVLWCKHMKLYSSFPKPDQEDCRLWVHKDRLWISYCDVAHVYPHWTCKIQVCRLTDDTLEVDQVIPIIKHGNNKKRDAGVEKNWIFFSHEDQLYCIYSTGDHHILKLNDKTGTIEAQWTNDSIWWPYGHIRGGTPPVRFGDHYLAFFHGSDYKAWLGRRYFLAPYMFEAKPPFKITHFADKPMVYGSRHEPYCGAGSAQCVFPMGIEVCPKEAIFKVSAGLNDTCNTIIDIPVEDVKDALSPADNFHDSKTFYFFSEKATQIPSPDGHNRFWTVFRSTAQGRWGVFKTDNPMVICELINRPYTRQIPLDHYDALIALDPETYYDYIGCTPHRRRR